MRPRKGRGAGRRAQAAICQAIMLRGSIDGLTAEEALDAVLRTSGLTFQRKGSRLVVTLR